MSKSVPFVGMVVSGIVGILFLADAAVAIHLVGSAYLPMLDLS